MASTKNSFDLLLSGGEDGGARPAKVSENNSSQNKNRRARRRAKNQAAKDELVDNAPDVAASNPPLSSAQYDSGAKEVVASAGLEQEHAGNLEDFIQVKYSSHSAPSVSQPTTGGGTSGTAQSATANFEESAERLVASTEQDEDLGPTGFSTASSPLELEKTALEGAASAFSGSPTSRIQLWYDWIARARNAQPDGQYGSLTWKQVLLQSQALEITVATCLQPPISTGDGHHLKNLLASFLASPEAGQVMAHVVQDLGLGLAGGPPDAKLAQAAQQAVTSSLTALKEGETGWAVQALAARMTDVSLGGKLKQLASKAAETEQQLILLRADPNEMTTLPERTRLSQQLVAMSEQRLVLLLPDDAPDPSEGHRGRGNKETPASRALHSIRHLAAQIRENRSHDAESAVNPSQKRAAGNGPSAKQGKGGNLQELQETAAQLAEEAAVLEAQLVAAEKEVERLRAAAAGVEARRQAVKAQLEGASQDDGSDLPGLDAQQALQQDAGDRPPQVQLWCAQQLGVVHTLEALLLRPPEAGVGRHSREEEEAVGVIMCQAVLEHLQALAGHTAHKQQQLKEAGQRLHFSQTKVATMEADLARLRSQGKLQLVKELEKPKETYVNMAKQWSARVEAIMAEAEGVESALQRPALRTAVALLPPQPPVHLLLNQISHLLHQIQLEHNAIKAGPPAAPAGEEAANGGQAERTKQRSSGPGRRREQGAGGNERPAGSRRGEGGAQKGRHHQVAAASAKAPEAASSNEGQVAPPKANHSNGHIPAPVPKENAWGVARPLPVPSELAALGYQGEGAIGDKPLPTQVVDTNI